MAKIIRIRGHHIPGILEYYKIRNAGSKKDPFQKLRAHGYCGEYIQNKRRVCSLLYWNPDQPVRVVNTLDDLCRVCNKKSRKCTNLLCTDAWTAGQYGLVCGDTYTSAQLFC